MFIPKEKYENNIFFLIRLNLFQKFVNENTKYLSLQSQNLKRREEKNLLNDFILNLYIIKVTL